VKKTGFCVVNVKHLNSSFTPLIISVGLSYEGLRKPQLNSCASSKNVQCITDVVTSKV